MEIPASKSTDEKMKQILEFWKNNSPYKSVDLQLFDKQGKVYTDGKFDSLIFGLLSNLQRLLHLKGTFWCLELMWFVICSRDHVITYVE